MSILSQMLNEAVATGKFKYHPKCEVSGLTHLCFADDLLIFSDGAPSSVRGILSVIDEFNLLSGLAISADKSCFFSSGLSEAQSQNVASVSGMPQGFFPIRYLGLPLCTKSSQSSTVNPSFKVSGEK